MRPPRAIAVLSFLSLLGVSASGCKLPQPIEVRTQVAMEPQSNKADCPIVQMPVGDAKPCHVKIAIIDVDGLMVNANQTGLMSAGTNPVEEFRAKLNYARRHPELQAIVLRIHSAGGGVTASDIMARDLDRFRQETGRPVIACLMDIGTGGAYYLASGSDWIVAHPTSITGGFGVILNLFNMEDMLAQMNIIGVPIKAGEQVDMGSPTRRIPEESRQLFDTIAEQFQTRFHERIARQRGVELSGQEAFLDGRILTAQQASDLQLIDSIGYLDDAIEWAATQAGSPVAQPVLLHRVRDRAQTIYSITPNRPIQSDLLPIDIPGIQRSKLPTFLYMWQPNPSYGG
jgi:protease-4